MFIPQVSICIIFALGPRAVLNEVVKRKIPSPRQESNPRTPIVQPVGEILFCDKEIRGGIPYLKTYGKI
jgi:hypothetical protein